MLSVYNANVPQLPLSNIFQYCPWGFAPLTALENIALVQPWHIVDISALTVQCSAVQCRHLAWEAVTSPRCASTATAARTCTAPALQCIRHAWPHPNTTNTNTTNTNTTNTNTTNTSCLSPRPEPAASCSKVLVPRPARSPPTAATLRGRTMLLHHCSASGAHGRIPGINI